MARKKASDKPVQMEILDAIRGQDVRELNKTSEQKAAEVGIKHDILEALRKGYAHKAPVRMENGFEFYLRLLSVEESSQVLRDAGIEFENLSDGEKINLLHIRSIMERTIHLATTSGPGAMDGWGMKTIKALTARELAAVYQEWEELEQRNDPSIDRMTQEQFDDLLDALEKKPDLLSECSLKQLRRIAQEWLQIRIELKDSSSMSS